MGPPLLSFNEFSYSKKKSFGNRLARKDLSPLKKIVCSRDCP